MEGIHNSSSIHKPNEQLWKDVNSLLANAMSMQGKLAQKDKELETVRGETQSKIELLDKGLEKHSRSFERMYGKLNDLVDLSLGHRPSSVSITLQRQLDDVRACLGIGFCVLFPKKFPIRDILENDSSIGSVDEALKNNSSQRSVDWWAFKGLLNKFFKGHLLFEPNNNSAIFQSRSVFRDLTNLIYVPGLSYDIGRRMPLPQPFCTSFESKYIGRWDEDRNQFEGFSDGQHTTNTLLFFLPAFIWAFNELREAVWLDQTCVRQLFWEVRLNERRMYKKEGKPLFSKIELITITKPDFALGTGLDTRRQWKVATRSGAGHISGEQASTHTVGGQAPARVTPSDGGQGVAQSPTVSTRRKMGAFGSDSNLEEGKTSVAKRRKITVMEEGATRVKHDAGPSKGASQDLLETKEDDEDDDDGITVDIKSAQNALAKLRAELEAEEKCHEIHLQRYNTIRRLLVVVLDKKFLELAVFGHSTLKPWRQASKHFVHKPNGNVFKNVMKRTREIIAEAPQSLGSEMSILDPVTVEKDARRLWMLVNDTNSYFSERLNVVEVAIDEHLKQVYERDPLEAQRWSDIRLLMLWLEGKQPTA